MKSSLLILVCAALMLTRRVIGCPQQCVCSSSFNNGYQVKCKGTFTTLPTGVPTNVTILTVIGFDNGSSIVNSITSTSLSSLTNLEALTLNRLGIGSIAADAFASNPSIKRLDLRHNRLSSVPSQLFSNTIQLVLLDLSYNDITTIKQGTLSPLSKLASLNLRNNAFTTLTRAVFKDLTKLEHVDMSNNPVATMENNIFEKLTSLRTVKLNNCSLTGIDGNFMSFIPRVKTFEVRDNRIASIPNGIFANTNSLSDLQLDGNQLNHLPSGVLNGLRLKILGLSRNNISFIDPRVFAEFSCEQLRLADNGMTSLAPAQFDALNQSLKFLYLAGNPFSSVTKSMLSLVPNVRNLDLSRTELNNFDVNIIEAMELQLLNISLNNFRSLDATVLDAFRKVRVVDLTGNNWNCTCFQKHVQTWLISMNYSQSCRGPGYWPNHASNKKPEELRKEFNCLICGEHPKINRGKLIVNLTAAELEQCYYSDAWFTVERQVLILAGCTCLGTLIFFVAFTLICKALQKKKKEYDLKTKTVNNQPISVIPDNQASGGDRNSNRAILASIEDLSGTYVNPAFERSDSHMSLPRKKRPTSISSIPSLDESDESMTVVIPNKQSTAPPPYDEISRLESCM